MVVDHCPTDPTFDAEHQELLMPSSPVLVRFLRTRSSIRLATVSLPSSCLILPMRPLSKIALAAIVRLALSLETSCSNTSVTAARSLTSPPRNLSDKKAVAPLLVVADAPSHVENGQAFHGYTYVKVSGALIDDAKDDGTCGLGSSDVTPGTVCTMTLGDCQGFLEQILNAAVAAFHYYERLAESPTSTLPGLLSSPTKR